MRAEHAVPLPPRIEGIAGLAERYDALILDLWGVIHNGIEPYPGVPDALDALRRAGKLVCLLSNAPRRCGSVEAKLSGMGIGPDLYDAILTSGEAVNAMLRQPPDSFFAGLGRRCYHLGPPRDADIFDALALSRVASPDDAEFVLNTGIDSFDETLDLYRPVLEAAATRGLPMVCANPDLVVTVGSQLAICAGTLAAHYETLGGQVRWIGKPHPEVYDMAFHLLGAPPRDRVLAIGDSLRTDIAGAGEAGIDSALVLGGIHAEEIGLPLGARSLDGHDAAALAAMLDAAPHRPDYLLAELAWRA